jgi:hypothetical protein
MQSIEIENRPRDGESLAAFAARHPEWKFDAGESWEAFVARTRGRSSPAREDAEQVVLRMDAGDDDDDDEDGEDEISAEQARQAMVKKKVSGSGWRDGHRVKDASGPSAGNVRGPGGQATASNRRAAEKQAKGAASTAAEATSQLEEQEESDPFDDLNTSVHNAATALAARCAAKPKARRDARSPAAAPAASDPGDGEEPGGISAAEAKKASDDRKYGRASAVKGR